MKKLLLMILVFFALIALSAESAYAFNCTVRQNNCNAAFNEIPILRMEDPLGGHAGTVAGSAYSNLICCNQTGDILYNDCNRPGNVTIFNLTAATNSHVQLKTYLPLSFPNMYTVDVCLSAQSTAEITCDSGFYGSDCSGYGFPGYTCVASINETAGYTNTNAHIGNCTANYINKVCCKVGFPLDTIPPDTTANLYCWLPGNNGWCKTNERVTLACTDNLGGSGCKRTDNCTDASDTCNPNIQYFVPFNITTEGIRYVRYNSTDYAGNIEAVNSTQTKIDKQKPKVDSVTASPNPIQSYKNITFSVLCSDPAPGSGCIKVNITTPFGSCAAPSGSTCNFTTPDNTQCHYGVYTYNATAEDNAGWANTTVDAGSFTVKKSEGCSCASGNECLSGFCMAGSCVTVSPPVIAPSLSGDIVVPLGGQGRMIVKIKNPLTTSDKIRIISTGNPPKFHNWVWFDGHRYDRNKNEILIELASGEQRAVAIDMFGGEVMSATIQVTAKSVLTGLESELEPPQGVSIEFSDDSINVKTPEIGWIEFIMIALMGAALII